jgi:hypothetical protein
MKTAESVNDALFEAFKAAATDDTGCIVYVFDRSEDGGGTGFNSKNCDAGDAMVAIKRISEQFGIDLERLAV